MKVIIIQNLIGGQFNSETAQSKDLFVNDRSYCQLLRNVIWESSGSPPGGTKYNTKLRLSTSTQDIY